MLTVSRKLAKILTDSRKSHHPIETLIEGKITECWLVDEESIFLNFAYEEGKIGPQDA